MHYKILNPQPNLYELEGGEFFFARFAREFTILYPHHEIRGAAPGMGPFTSYITLHYIEIFNVA